MHRQLEKAAPGLLPQCEELGETVRGATARLRHLLFDLDSPAKTSDLRSAIEEAASYIFENDVRWRVEGSVEAPEVARVIAYRVAKEALTNIRKHAGRARAAIRVTCTDAAIVAEICNDRARTVLASAPVPGGGHGLIGMRERVMMYGGDFTAGPRPEGGFAVAAAFPYEA